MGWGWGLDVVKVGVKAVRFAGSLLFQGWVGGWVGGWCGRIKNKAISSFN